MYKQARYLSILGKGSVVMKDNGNHIPSTCHVEFLCTTKNQPLCAPRVSVPPFHAGAANRVGPTPRRPCRRPARAVDGWFHLQKRPDRGETWGTRGVCFEILGLKAYSVLAAIFFLRP